MTCCNTARCVTKVTLTELSFRLKGEMLGEVYNKQ